MATTIMTWVSTGCDERTLLVPKGAQIMEQSVWRRSTSAASREGTLLSYTSNNGSSCSRRWRQHDGDDGHDGPDLIRFCWRRQEVITRPPLVLLDNWYLLQTQCLKTPEPWNLHLSPRCMPFAVSFRPTFSGLPPTSSLHAVLRVNGSSSSGWSFLKAKCLGVTKFQQPISFMNFSACKLSVIVQYLGTNS